MIVPPKGLVNFTAGLVAASLAHRLRRPNAGHAAQPHAYRALTRRLAATRFGREVGIEPRMPYETFRSRVALHTYEMLAPYLERMKRGEPDVLWPGRCSFFAVSAGTTTGRPKYLPVGEEMLAHFRTAGLRSLLFYAVRAGHAGFLRGRHLLLGGTHPLAPLSGSTRRGPFAGDLSALASVILPAWADRHLYEPGQSIAQMDDWPAKLNAIAERTRRRDITVLAGLPNWVLALSDVLRTGATAEAPPAPSLRALWPNLECFVHGGLPVAPFADELRQALGPEVKFHELYPASEGFIAAQDGDAAAGLRLLVDVGLFFEFLPMTAFDETNLSRLGSKAVPLEEVHTEVDYALLLTTPGGLCRYVLGDVVRFVSTAPPRLTHVGRTHLRLNAFGENVREGDVTEALATVCRRHGWSIVNFHLAPIFASTLTGQTRGSHEWWIELKVPTIETPTANVLGPELDAVLLQRHPEYRAKRNGKIMEPPVIRLVMPGVFEQWMKRNGRWGGLYKVPRCRSDRMVADQLAELSRFYIETRPPYFVRQG